MIIISQQRYYNLNKMQKGNQVRNRNDSKLKNLIDKYRVNANTNQSRNKKLIATQSVNNADKRSNTLTCTMGSSPILIKDIDNEKQNMDIYQSALRIMSAAAENREKEILLSLCGQIEKQKKIKIFMTQKQSTSQITELQSMLAHLRQEQAKQIKLLKIQIGKRKLQNLDENDLRTDIINLNSYVMRRSKKDTISIKNKGIDIIGQIYNKFDQLTNQLNYNAINQVSQCDCQQKESHLKRDSEQQVPNNVNKKKGQLKSKNEFLILHNDQNYRNSNWHEQSALMSSTHEQLMYKILSLEKENLKLNKQIKKIQQQFQYVVQEKLLLEQKIYRKTLEERGKKQQIVKYFSQLKLGFTDYKQFKQLFKQEINILLNSFKQELNQQLKRFEDKKLFSNNLQQSRRQVDYLPQIQNNLSEKVNNSFQSQFCSQAVQRQKYDLILAQKQLQINRYLKTMTKLAQQNKSLEQQLANHKQNYTRIQIEYQQQICKLMQKLKINEELQVKQRNENENDRKKLSDYINKIQGILTTQKSKLQSDQKQLKQSIENIQKENRKIIMEKEMEINSLKNQKQKQIQAEKAINIQIRQQIKQLRKSQQSMRNLLQQKSIEMKVLRQQTQHLNNRNNNMQKQKTCLAQQLRIQIQQAQNTKNEIIQQCSMLLEAKTEQILIIKQQVQRQKMQKQDLLSYIMKNKNKHSQYCKQKQKQQKISEKLNKILNKLQQCSKQSNKIRKNIQNNITQFRTQISLIWVQIDRKIKQIMAGASSSRNLSFNFCYKILDVHIEPAEKEKKNKQFYSQFDILLQKYIGKDGDALDQSFRKQKIRDFLITINSVLFEEINKQLPDMVCQQNFSKQLTEIKAITPRLNKSSEQSNNSDFLQQFKSDNGLLPFCEQKKQIQVSLSDIINQTGFVEEVEALKNQLRDCFKRNQALLEELKIYQQKDIDNIFDF